MNKRGQIYLIVSLLVGLVILALTSQPNTINVIPSDDDFRLVSQNYNQESAKFLSSLIENGETDTDEVKNKFTEFSIIFTQYSKSQNPTFGLVYFLNYGNRLYVGNFLDKSITINPTIPGCYNYIQAVIKYGSQGNIRDNLPLVDINEKQCNQLIPVNIFEDNTLEMRIGEEDFVYEINIIPGQPEVMVISRETQGEDRKVFVEKQFIKGKRDKKDRNQGRDNDDDED
ncbi:hypothetical protein J4449_00680 [Candidatus Woesearchaeota archaeon]|nr:hypothetical protein [Candidatus Woesearchaeota archaeon]